jgi:hypothetical protein
MTFSFNPLDQARVLAVGFHRLVERLVNANVPITFISFPRAVEDPDYLFDKLKLLLPNEITLDQFRLSHQRVADPSFVRVGREHRAEGGMPNFEELDNIALRRELVWLHRHLAKVEAEMAHMKQLREHIGAEPAIPGPVRLAGSPSPQRIARSSGLLLRLLKNLFRHVVFYTDAA